MGCKSGLSSTDIFVQQMRDGQMAVVTQWCGDTCTIGKVVQRCADRLIVLGEHSGRSFDTVQFATKCTAPGNENCRVRLLEVGDVIQIDKIVSN